MAHDRTEAKRLYIEEGLKVQEIARRLDINEKTIYRWRDEEKWDEEKEEIANTSTNAVKQTFLAAISALGQITEKFKTEKVISSADVQNARMLIKSAKELQKDVDMLGNILIAQREWTQFMQERDPELLTKMLPYLMGFKDEMKKKYGKR